MTNDLLRELEESIEKLRDPQNIEALDLARQKSGEIQKFFNEIELLRKDWKTIESWDYALRYLETLHYAVKSFQEKKSSLQLDEDRREILQERLKELSSLELAIEYYADSDTLVISNGLDEHSTIDMSEEVLIGFDVRGRPSGITVENATALLKPHLLEAMLAPGQQPSDSPQP